MQASRPGVSRALQALRGQGLVENEVGQWQLTSAGHQEVRVIQTGVPREMRAAIEGL
jgi:hypothetical protein